jgi:hypothetical protein
MGQRRVRTFVVLGVVGALGVLGAGCGDDDDDDDAGGGDVDATAVASTAVCDDVAAVESALEGVREGGWETSVRAALADPLDQLAEDVGEVPAAADELVALQGSYAALESAAAALGPVGPEETVAALGDEIAQVEANWSAFVAATGCPPATATATVAS